MKLVTTALAAAAVLASTGVAAAPRESVALKLNTAGVNFADPSSVEAFRKDVDRQIAAVCNPSDRVGADYKPDFRCRKEMKASVEPTLSRLVAAAGRQVAYN
jgi:UrcA family protein